MTTSGHAITPEIAAMLQQATRKRFAPKSLIMREGENSDVLYFILAGSVTVLVEDPHGEELILAYLGPGEFFGELSLFDTAAKRSASVRARTDCELAVITYERFRDLMQAAPGQLLPLIGQIARRLRAASQKLGNLAFVDVAGRIARALLDLAADSEAITHPDGMLVRITREELGRLVNCSREMAGRVLLDLQQQGLIEVHGKSIVVRGVFPFHAPAKDPSTP
ncbi:MAG TPA: cAMP-activated global transcriptional regulator CRP [Acidiferrobacterales bacterium]|nr:cAMP-activated global transcriptional regulator CRP [Acidiferrobacterales bacterium]